VNYAGLGQPANMRRIGWNNIVFSSDLSDLIVQYFPHRETYTGFTAARLATMLSRFDIQPEPRVKRRGSDNGTRWYRRAAFDEWFTRYGFEPPDETVEMEPAENSPILDEPTSAPATGATPTREVPYQETADGNAEDSTAPDPEAGVAEPVEPSRKPDRRLTVEPARGEKKRAGAMRRALDAWVEAGKLTHDDVLFESPWFSVIERDGQRFWTTIGPEPSDLDTLPLDGAPVVDSNAGTITIGRTNVAADLSAPDFQRLRALVNKYAKRCAL